MDVVTRDPSDKKNWVVIYPAYINSKRSLADGRRIPKDKGVENPTVSEMNDIFKSCGLTTEVEDRKMYPRDPNRDFHFQGRIRVQLKNADGSLLHAEYPTRNSLMLVAAEMIPKLKSRLQKSQQGGATAQSEATAGGAKGAQKKKKK